MEARNYLIFFIVLVITFAFSFVFGQHSLAYDIVLYGILATVGYALCIGVAIIFAMIIRTEGGGLAAWFSIYTVVAAIIFVWYLTRAGVKFGWW